MGDIIDQAQQSDELFRANALGKLLSRKQHAPLIRIQKKRNCEDCGESIPAKRLKANPAATRCVTCQTLAEKRGHDDE
ncbi:MAG: TraR/DksA family transcriptional regulator [Smithella sp.]|jgi:DnaK suppressor protein